MKIIRDNAIKILNFRNRLKKLIGRSTARNGNLNTQRKIKKNRK